MPTIYIAYRTDTRDGDNQLIKLADANQAALRRRLRAWPASEWAIAQYRVPVSVATLIRIIENLATLEPQDITGWRVSNSMQVRRIEPDWQALGWLEDTTKEAYGN
jgi:hypothetical protein